MTILLDSQTIVWFAENRPQLGRRARHAIERAGTRRELAASAISFWEIAVNVEKGRIRIESPRLWRNEILALGVIELPVTGEIGVGAAELGSFHGDPADRIVVATARRHDATLMTSDGQILRWPGELKRQDARK